MWDLQDTTFGILVTISFIYGLGALYQGSKKQTNENANIKARTSIYRRFYGIFNLTDYPLKPFTKDDFPQGITRPVVRNNQIRKEDPLFLASETALGKFIISTVKCFKRREIPRDDKVTRQNKPIRKEDKPRKEEEKPKKHWSKFWLNPSFKRETA